MIQIFKKIGTILIVVLVIIFGCLVFFRKYPNFIQSFKQTPKNQTELSEDLNGDRSGWKIFEFNNFHGEKITDGFRFSYPTTWFNNDQYFSPVKIKFYDISSPDAPVYFDLVSELIFDTSDIRYQIQEDKKRTPDIVTTIDRKTFRRFDLIDYRSKQDLPNRVIIFLSHNLKIAGGHYFIVFRWEERPLDVYIPNNDPKIFEEIVSTLKFK